MTDTAATWPQRVNPLTSAAQPLLLSVGLLVDNSPPESPQTLQQALLDHLETFSNTVENSDPKHLDSARYALCALLDETIASTNWGAAVWPDYSLLRQIYNQDYSGEEFFKRLEGAGKEREAGVALLEFFHLCLSLGYSGRFHQRRQTDSRIKHMRSQVASLIEQYRDSAPPALSPPLKLGRQRRPVPIWIVTTVLAAILLGAYQGMSWHLTQVGEPLLKNIQGMARSQSR